MLNVEAAVALIEQGLDATAAVARVEAVPAPCDLEWVVKRHRVRAGLAARRDDAATAVAEARARHAALAGAGGPTTAIVLRGGGAVLAALEGRHAEARADMAEARSALAERGLDRLATYLALLDVVVQTLAGDPAAAERAVEDARATAPSASDR